MLIQVFFCLLTLVGSNGPGWGTHARFSPSPHVYPDGFVERALSIVVRDGRAYGEYSIGLNEKTADQVLEQARQQWNEIQQVQGSKQPSQRGQLDGSGDDGGLQASQGEQNPVSPSSASDIEAGAGSGEGEHLTDPEIIKQFSRFKAGWFESGLKVNLDQQAVTLEKVKVEPAPRHPFSMIVRFEFDLTASQQQSPRIQSDHRPRQLSLEVVDQLFAGQDGAIRYALKTRGRTMLLRSTAAPILVRADRHELSGWEPQKRNKMSRISAKLAISPKRE